MLPSLQQVCIIFIVNWLIDLFFILSYLIIDSSIHKKWRESTNTNTIDEIKKLIKENLYHDLLEEDDYFFFNVAFDENSIN